MLIIFVFHKDEQREATTVDGYITEQSSTGTV